MLPSNGPGSDWRIAVYTQLGYHFYQLKGAPTEGFFSRGNPFVYELINEKGCQQQDLGRLKLVPPECASISAYCITVNFCHHISTFVEVPMRAKIHTVPTLLGTFGRLNEFSFPILHILFIFHWIS
jgi:hypothetical protein